MTAASNEVAADITRNPEAIWLSPICDDFADHGDGRTWAAPAPDETCEDADCNEPWVKYVRDDLARAHSDPRPVAEGLREALAKAERQIVALYRAAAPFGNYGVNSDGSNANENTFADNDEAVIAARAALATHSPAPMAGEVVTTLRQYIDDLRYPPTGDSIERRIAAAEQAIRKLAGGVA